MNSNTTVLYTHDEFIRPVVAECLVKYFNLNIKIVEATKDTEGFLSNFPVRRVPGLLFEDDSIIFEQMAVTNYIIHKGGNKAEIAELLGSSDDYLTQSEIIMICSFCTSDFFSTLVLFCLNDIKGTPISNETASNAAKKLEAMYPIFERKLALHKYLTSDNITLADLIAAASFSKGFTSMFGPEWRAEHPLIVNWFFEVINSKYMEYRFKNFKLTTKAHKISHRMLPWD
ncbi:similar to Naumovozyma castellii NCAS_0A00130 hypothetical protein [Maudiozyma saulgeensis]|uniref:GST C-terminal domain-containing protein n=1 Tax=Maudiozyma saulgeensis TaxID=1789683 RepID=A0A1X7R1C6_9SACH|nr:similar to Naumovozyma castellii NCAS_0A00130 hypothetical protein [Kazachstania saulgeensis]